MSTLLLIKPGSDNINALVHTHINDCCAMDFLASYIFFISIYYKYLVVNHFFVKISELFSPKLSNITSWNCHSLFGSLKIMVGFTIVFSSIAMIILSFGIYGLNHKSNLWRQTPWDAHNHQYQFLSTQ